MLTKILMGIQFDLPISEQPFSELAEKIKVDEDYLLRKVNELKTKGVIKRVGIDLNYKALKESYGALIGLCAPFGKISNAAKCVNAFKPKHNFWRDHWKYNLWFTLKAENKSKLREKVLEIIKKTGCTDYVFLPTIRIYRMNVKYDLINGISLSSGRIEPEKVEKLEELGINEDFVKKLVNLKISKRPFLEFKKEGYCETEVVDLIVELMSKGIIRDFFGTLNERKIGFNVNCMFALKVEENDDKVSLEIARKYPQITHLIRREADENWPYTIYFMLHAKERDQVENIGNKIIKEYKIKEFEKLYSLMDLKAETILC